MGEASGEALKLKEGCECARFFARSDADYSQNLSTVCGFAVWENSRIHRYRIRSLDSQLNRCLLPTPISKQHQG